MKMKKRIMALVVALVMLLTAIPVQAAKQVKVDLEKEQMFVKQVRLNKLQYIGTVTGTKKFSVSVSNKSILTVTKKKSDLDKDTIVLYAKIKKPGKTTVTVKAGGKKYRSKITVSKYVQGFSSLKIGDVTIPGSKLNKTDKIYIKYSKVANKKVKVTAKMKKNWWSSSIENGANKGYVSSLGFNTPVKFTSGPGGYLQFCTIDRASGGKRYSIIRVCFVK